MNITTLMRPTIEESDQSVDEYLKMFDVMVVDRE